MKILVVDDERVARLAMIRSLEKFGHQVLEAESGEQAWEIFAKEPIQFLFTDFVMPGLNGPGLAHRIRTAGATNYTYIVLVSAIYKRRDVVEALEAGVDAFMPKPFHVSELGANLRAGERILRLEQSLRERTEQNISINKRLRGIVQREQLTNQVLRAMSESLDLTTSLRKALQPLQGSLQASRAFVQLYSGTNNSLRLAAESCATGIRAIGQRTFQVEPEEQAIWSNGQILSLPDLAKQKQGLSSKTATVLEQDHAVRSLLYVPIIYQGKWLGTIGLHQCDKPRVWTEDEIALVDRVSSPMAMAVVNATLYQQVQEQALRDGLTGLYNRRYFDKALAHELERAKRYGHSLALVLMDLDYLKKINDQLGHQAGDTAIREIGRTLQRLHRKVDVMARFGGEEFVAVMAHTAEKGALVAAETWRAAINELTIEQDWWLSASLGVAVYPTHGDNPEDLIKAADEALYRAKHEGRNRVCLAEPSVRKAAAD